MRVKWQPLAAGAVVAAAGWFLFTAGNGFLEGAVPRAPSIREGLLVLTGGILLLVGATTALVPNVLWLLRALYGDDFGKRATCPVMVACPDCGTANARGKAACKSCAASLAGAKALGGEEPGETAA